MGRNHGNSVYRRWLMQILAIGLLGAKSLFADTVPPIPHYTEAPTFYEFFPNAFADLPHYFENIDPREHQDQYLWIAGSSLFLIYYDQKILNTSRHFAEDIHLIDEKEQGGQTRVIWRTKVRDIDAPLRLPTSPNTYLYYIGDGITSLGIVAGLTTYGGLTENYRALNTASQLMESMVLTGMFVITGKYSAGRQSPTKATRPGGEWNPMPGVLTYLHNISTYDAFPSGHIATVTSTLTVLHKNYPEVPWLLPVGFTSMGLLMFAMLNNGVHWAGDYPLGIAIGYVAAETVFNKRKPKDFPQAHSTYQRRDSAYNIHWQPFVAQNSYGLSLEWHM